MKRLLFCTLAILTLPAQGAVSYPAPIRCVPRCETRYLDGTCATSAPDFCGHGAKCVPKCEQRYLDGSCARFGADYCGFEREGAYGWAEALTR